MAIYRGYQLIANNADTGSEKFSTSAVTEACLSAVENSAPEIVNGQLQLNNDVLLSAIGSDLASNNSRLVDTIADAVVQRMAESGIGRDPEKYSYPTFQPTFTPNMYASRLEFRRIAEIPSALVEGSLSIGQPTYDSTDKRMHFRSNPIYIDPDIHPDPQMVIVELNYQSSSASDQYYSSGIYIQTSDGLGGVTNVPVYSTENWHKFRYSFIAFPGLKFGFYSTYTQTSPASTIFGLSSSSCIGSITILNNQGFLVDDIDYMMYGNDVLSSSVVTLSDDMLVSPVGFLKTSYSDNTNVTLMISSCATDGKWLPIRTVSKNYYNCTAPTSFGQYWLSAGTALAFRADGQLNLAGTIKGNDGKSYKCGSMHLLSAATSRPPASEARSATRYRWEFPDGVSADSVQLFRFENATDTRIKFAHNGVSSESFIIRSGGSHEDYYSDMRNIRSVDAVLCSDAGAIKLNCSQNSDGAYFGFDYLISADLRNLTIQQCQNVTLAGAPQLTSIALPSDKKPHYNLCKNCSNLRNFTIGYGVPFNVIPAYYDDYIADNMFYGCGFQDLSIWLSSQNGSRTGVFQNCKDLRSVTVVSDGNIVSTTNGCDIFSGCDNLKHVTEIYGPNAVTASRKLLGRWQYYTAATDITVSAAVPMSYAPGYVASLRELSSLAFYGISGAIGANPWRLPTDGVDLRLDFENTTLTSIGLPIYSNTVKYIDLPDSLVQMPSFSECSSLVSAFIPQNVRAQYGSNTFLNSKLLEYMSFQSSSPSAIVKILTNKTYESGVTTYDTTISRNAEHPIDVYYGATRSNRGTYFGKLYTNTLSVRV